MQSWTVQLFPRMGAFFLISGIAMALNGCSVLFPDRTAPKSSSYQITPPDAPWDKLRVGNDASSLENLQADLAYENPDTGAMISLNSLCRKYNDESLNNLSLNLVRGIENRQVMEEKRRTIGGVEGLDTLYEGIVDKVHLFIRTVVLVKNYCTYDFIYVAIPAREKNSRQAFDSFVNSFRVE